MIIISLTGTCRICRSTRTSRTQRRNSKALNIVLSLVLKLSFTDNCISYLYNCDNHSLNHSFVTNDDLITTVISTRHPNVAICIERIVLAYLPSGRICLFLSFSDLLKFPLVCKSEISKVARVVSRCYRHC